MNVHGIFTANSFGITDGNIKKIRRKIFGRIFEITGCEKDFSNMIVQLRVGQNKKEIDVREVERLAAMGLSVPQIARSLKVGKSTLERKLAALISFKTALRRGREKFNGENL